MAEKDGSDRKRSQDKDKDQDKDTQKPREASNFGTLKLSGVCLKAQGIMTNMC